MDCQASALLAGVSELPDEFSTNGRSVSNHTKLHFILFESKHMHVPSGIHCIMELFRGAFHATASAVCISPYRLDYKRS